MPIVGTHATFLGVHYQCEIDRQGRIVTIVIGISAEAPNPLTIVANVHLHGTTFPVVGVRNLSTIGDSIHVADLVRNIEESVLDDWSSPSPLKFLENSDLFTVAVPDNVTEIHNDYLLGCSGTRTYHFRGLL
jgi:hypothetical protein